MPQDWQRYLLIIGLAVLAYLLVLQWNEDYGGVSDSQLSDDVPELTSPSEGDSPLGLAPQENRGDVPDATLIAGAQAGAPREVQQDTGKAVHVRTQVLDLWIDLVGGDIVRARLPAHPLSLETPDIPFPLLDRGNGREYVAQSGLVGPDGTDDASGRPVYATALREYATEEGQTLEVTLEMLPKAGKEHVRVEKVYRFVHDDYLADLQYRVTNTGSEIARVNLFAQFKHDGGEAFAGESSGLGPRPYVGAALQTREDRYFKLDFGRYRRRPVSRATARRLGGHVAALLSWRVDTFGQRPQQLCWTKNRRRRLCRWADRS